MRSWAVLGLVVATFWGLPAAASAAPPATSPRPVARPVTELVPPPIVKPEVIVIPQEVLRASVGLRLSPRPKARPAKVVQQAKQNRRLRQRGAVCGDLDLQGEPVGAVPGKIRGCGIKDAVRVTSVSGVTLVGPATIDCTTAKALKRWLDKGLKPAVGRRGGGVAKLRVYASYACRTRNSRKGAKISEHGKGRAIDIGAIGLRDGSEITVLEGWNNRRDGKILRKAHRAACGPFGTVLGPDADRFHRDHFHFDTAKYRRGSYCR